MPVKPLLLNPEAQPYLMNHEAQILRVDSVLRVAKASAKMWVMHWRRYKNSFSAKKALVALGKYHGALSARKCLGDYEDEDENGVHDLESAFNEIMETSFKREG